MTATRDLTDPRRAGAGANLEAGLKAPLYETIQIPESFGPIEVLVDDLKVKRCAFVLDDFGDWYLRPGPGEQRIAHAAILANDLLQLFTTRYAPSQVVGLHTEEQLWFHRPILVGETVRLRGRYTEKFERRGHGYVVMEADALGADGQPVIRHRGVEIMRTAPAQVGGRGSSGSGGGERHVSGEFDRSIPLARQLGADAVIGMGLVPIEKEVTFEQMAVFSRIGEYVTNIHNNLRTARAAGLQVPIAQGQHLVGFVTEMLTRSYGLHWFYGGWLRAKLLRPVSAGESISVEGAVSAIKVGEDATDIEVEFWVRRDDMSLAAVGWAVAGVPNGTTSQMTSPSGTNVLLRASGPGRVPPPMSNASEKELTSSDLAHHARRTRESH